MELEHSFTVPVPRERAWDVLLDIERVAPCMPGATLDSVDGDEIHGKVKVKIGPINMTYAGTAHIVERDKANGVVRLEAAGKETKGAGTASATVRSVLEDRGDQTGVVVLTTLNVTGKPAQFGRGVMNEVGGKLLTIFASNLAAMLSESGTEGEGEGEASASADASTDANAGVTDSGPDAASMSVDDLHLNARAAASLHREGVTTAGQLAGKSAHELLAIDGIGRASVEEITAKLAEHGLTLASSAAATAEEPATPAEAVTSSPDPGPAKAPSTSVAPPSPEAAAANGHARPAAQGHAGSATQGHARPVRRSKRRQDDSINLLSVAGMPVLKRSIPVLAGVTAILIFGWRRKIHRRKP
jgi:carbon monoxide dehydrogenase subunit G